ncbi:carboxypeptidase-like regulatory domain-containing protein [Chitinispirillales bacterium ANBcel5]|uniref:carboxypeptidase-like regulatory domain-containing protein n=1 Tax=Cellulosispirillum alkaliphilum TaxID=3039283 RepID=UPI002A52748C|nr:carboxypeptidase-like regulatory domain-containing protein [Chitinispirillales bacterium ANBcel5]
MKILIALSLITFTLLSTIVNSEESNLTQDGTYTVSGTVTDIESGEPIAGARVIIRRGQRATESGGGMNISWKNVTWVNTDSGGAYEIDGLEISADENDIYGALFSHDYYNSTGSPNFLLLRDTTINLKMTPVSHGGVYVSVQNHDGKPMEGITVVAEQQMSSADAYFGVTYSLGMWHGDQMVSEVYSVNVYSENIKVKSVICTITTTETDTLHFELEESDGPWKALKVSVTDEGGEVIELHEDAYVALRFGSRGVDRTVMVSRELTYGVFTIPFIPSEYDIGRVEIKCEIWRADDIDIELESDTTQVHFDMRLRPTSPTSTSRQFTKHNSRINTVLTLDGLKVSGIESHNTKVELFSINGRKLFSTWINHSDVTIPLPSEIASGILMLRISMDGEVINQMLPYTVR